MSARLKDPDNGKNLVPKREIERFRELITKKIKECPDDAKKAARIIEELLQSEPKKK